MSLRSELGLARRSFGSLSPRIALFLVRARLRAKRTGDQFSVDASVRPEKLSTLLRHAKGRRHIVELGTGTAWATIALALDDPQRRIVSYDPFERDRERYLSLVPAAVRDRITLIAEPGEVGPADGTAPVDLLFIDSSHLREPTVAEYTAWLPAMTPGGVIIFDDYGHHAWPGVAEAVTELGAQGTVEADLFVAPVAGAAAAPRG
ncbi:MAG: class I SAM-dependent methyltransferase [Solirubrobacteraceae bacterium]